MKDRLTKAIRHRSAVFVVTYAALAVVFLLLAIRDDLEPFSGNRWLPFWGNCLIGPLAIARVLQAVTREWVPFLAWALPLTIGCVAYPIRPRWWTAIVTVISLVLWFGVGYYSNAMGVT